MEYVDAHELDDNSLETIDGESFLPVQKGRNLVELSYITR